MSTKRDLIDTALSLGEFNTFTYALNAAGLTEGLKGSDPFTVFAPTDEAFKKLPPEEVEALLNDKERLTAVLNRHMLRGSLHSWDLTHGDARTMEGSKIRIGATDDGFTVDHANVTQKDIDASNGVIHAIDALIIPGREAARTHAADTQESPWSGRRRLTRPQRAVK